MSKFKTIRLTCPGCSEEFEFDVYESVNVTLDKNLKEKVMDGSLFAAICPKCGHLEMLLHPFLYHDMDRKFMIQLNSYPNLLDFQEEFVEQNKINELFPGLMDDIQAIGVTSLADMVTTVISLENGLDWKVVQMALLYMEYDFIKYCNDNKIKIKKINYSGLMPKRNEDGELVLILDVGEGEENKQFYSPFPMQVYEHCLKEYKERLDLINPFIFDRQMREHFCNFYEEDFTLQEEYKQTHYFVERVDGSIIICSAFPFVDLSIGSLVLVDMANGEREVGTIKRIVDYNFLCISVDKEYCGRIVSNYTELHMMTSYDSGATLNQDDLVNALVSLKEKNYQVGANDFPTQDLRQSNMFMCSITTMPFKFEELAELIDKNTITDTSSMVTNIQKVERDGKLYLAAYTDQFYLPSKEECYSNSVFPFDDFVRIVKNDTRYDGIIINQYDEDIVLDVDTLRDYIKYRTLTDEEELKKLLNDLTSIEIEFMSKLSYDCIRAVYFDGDTPKTLPSRFGVTDKQVDKALRRGYTCLREIIYARF